MGELLHSRGDLLASQVKRLIPADGFPLVLAAFPHALHGMQHMARAVQCLNLAQALQAHTALVQRSIGIALDLHHFAILGVHANRTAIRATVTCGFMHHTLNRLRGKRLVGVLEQLHGFRGRQSRTHRGSNLREAATGHVRCRHVLSYHLVLVRLEIVSPTPWQRVRFWPVPSPSPLQSNHLSKPARRCVPTCQGRSSAEAVENC